MVDLKIRVKEIEDFLRKEVSSLKVIIKDFEDRLGKISFYVFYLYIFVIGFDLL